MSQTKEILTKYLDCHSNKDMLFLKAISNQSEQVSIIKGGKEWRQKTSKYILINWFYRAFRIHHWYQLRDKVKVKYVPINNQDSQ